MTEKKTAESVRRHSVNHNPSGCSRSTSEEICISWNEVIPQGVLLPAHRALCQARHPAKGCPLTPIDSASKPLGKYRDLGILAGQTKST